MSEIGLDYTITVNLYYLWYKIINIYHYIMVLYTVSCGWAHTVILQSYDTMVGPQLDTADITDKWLP